MHNRVELLASALALALAIATPATAAVSGSFTDHRPFGYPLATPRASLGHAVTAVAGGRDVRADGWLEHCEVQLLNRRAYDLAGEHRNADAQSLAATPGLQNLERARRDLFAGKPRQAQHQMDAAVPLLSVTA
jgi:hypothetical protein